MKSPIGGPRVWRRLVSRWWRTDQRMQHEWEQRAQTDALGYIGRGYAENEAAFWASGESDVTQHILDGVTLTPDAHALEIGCGVGRLMRPLANRLAQVNGVDIAPGMIEKGRHLLADLPNARFETTDGSLAMFADNSLDYVYSFVVFQHIPSKRAIARYIRESARVLKPGGIFKFQVDGRARSVWHGSDTWLGVWFRPDEIRQLLHRVGFSVIDTWGEQTQYYWITARRNSASNVAVHARAHSPVWNPSALTSLLSRLGHGEIAPAEIMTGRRSLRDPAQSWVNLNRGLADQEFVQAAFQAVLDRAADSAGSAFYTRQLSQGVTRSYFIDCLLSSAELRAMVRNPGVTAP